MSDVTNVFISYAHQDRVIAYEIRNQLTILAQHGKGRPYVECFLDAESILPSQKYGPVIMSALQKADWLIVIFTGDQSSYCGFEIGMYSTMKAQQGVPAPIVCLHDVDQSKIPAMLDEYKTTLISAAAAYLPDGPLQLTNDAQLWWKSDIRQVLTTICSAKQLYVPDDRQNNPLQYQIDLAQASSKISQAFETASQEDEVWETPIQPGFELTIYPPFGTADTRIPDSSVLVGSSRAFDILGLIPPLQLEAQAQAPQITWGELRQKLTPPGGSNIPWLDKLEANIGLAADLKAPEPDDVTFRGNEDNRIYRAILTRHKLFKNGKRRLNFLLVETLSESQPQAISFLYATNRQSSSDGPYFSGERADGITYGTASVQIPDSHKIGKIELPFKLKLFSLTLYEQAPDPQKHFIVESIDIRSVEDWMGLISSSSKSNALVFVHGFNTTFSDAVYRAGQIFWDLQYHGVPVLFSWPSRGAILDYIYDKDSALTARDAFIEVLRRLRTAGVTRIDILAHSMGNLVVLDSLANHRHADNPLGIAEILMAAPDVDQNNYRSLAAKDRAVVSGMTLYASSADRALAASKHIAGNIARAGDVPEGGPILVDGIDAIDVTAIGEELFGLGHSPYATTVSILNDIAILINEGKRPPNTRLPVEVRGMPSGQLPPSWWYLLPR